MVTGLLVGWLEQLGDSQGSTAECNKRQGSVRLNIGSQGSSRHGGLSLGATQQHRSLGIGNHISGPMQGLSRLVQEAAQQVARPQK
ncbi:hypothetical protein NL676_007942 [Syzygium grande]|nr:hypothetical protein NL676_007942 [Syzygium grande]